MTARNLEQTIAAIRTRRIFMRAGGVTPRRGRMPRQVYPRIIEQGYLAKLRAFVQTARAQAREHLLPELPGLLQEASGERGDSAVRLDDWSDRIGALIQRAKAGLARIYPDERVRELADGIARQTSGYHREQLLRQLKNVLGVDVFRDAPGLLSRARAFVAENVALIKSLPERAFAEVEQRVMSGVRAGRRNEDLARDIEERFSVSESRAIVIARDQVGKFYGELQRVRQTALGIDGYVWRTAQDERVRDAHAAREGKRFSWDSPPYDGHPGEPVQCRCWADPDIEGLLGALEEDADDEEVEE